MSQPPIKEKLLHAFVPAHLIALGIYQYILEIHDILFVQHEPGILVQFSKLRDRAFSRFWIAYGESMAEMMPDETVDLLRSVRGTVLEVGPGSGEQAVHFDASRIAHVYGVEPAGTLHGKLRAKVKRAGLEDKYTVLGCGAQPESLVPALAGAGLFEHGAAAVFDEICCIRVLCGVPRPEETVQGLYRLLKPGGRLVVLEHVANAWRQEGGSVVSRLMQAVYRLAGWNVFLGCNIDRHTKEILLNAGGKDGWSEVKLTVLKAWSVLPHCTGYLVKRE